MDVIGIGYFNRTQAWEHLDEFQVPDETYIPVSFGGKPGLNYLNNFDGCVNFNSAQPANEGKSPKNESP